MRSRVHDLKDNALAVGRIYTKVTREMPDVVSVNGIPQERMFGYWALAAMAQMTLEPFSIFCSMRSLSTTAFVLRLRIDRSDRSILDQARLADLHGRNSGFGVGRRLEDADDQRIGRLLFNIVHFFVSGSSTT